MKKNDGFLFLILLLTAGCSPRGWIARLYIVQAENAVGEASQLKEKKVAFEHRLPYYVKACDNYAKAYDADPSVFTFVRIEEAVDCCWKANNHAQEEAFKEFEEKYVKSHPQEYEHGDSGMTMMDMGG